MPDTKSVGTLFGVDELFYQWLGLDTLKLSQGKTADYGVRTQAQAIKFQPWFTTAT